MRKSGNTRRKLIIGIVAAAILLIGAFLMSLQIRTITVTGNHQYTSEQMIEMLFGGRWDRNSLYCFFNDRFGEHKEIPFVEDYEIEFQSPVAVEVIVYEKSVVGYVSYMGSNMYFDKDGIIVESTTSQLEGVPRIEGLDFGHIVLHQPLPVVDEGVFNDILNLTQLLTTYEIQVDEVRYDSSGKCTLILGDIRVYLGSGEQMNGKIAELRDQLPVLTGYSGTLYLDTYDETNTSPSYRFIKDQ